MQLESNKTCFQLLYGPTNIFNICLLVSLLASNGRLLQFVSRLLSSSAASSREENIKTRSSSPHPHYYHYFYFAV